MTRSSLIRIGDDLLTVSRRHVEAGSTLAAEHAARGAAAMFEQANMGAAAAFQVPVTLDTETVVRLTIAAQAGAGKLLELIPILDEPTSAEADVDQFTIGEATTELAIALRGTLGLLTDVDEDKTVLIAALDRFLI